MFQSAVRISVWLNPHVCSHDVPESRVSISRADLCLVERITGATVASECFVSIRRADLCLVEMKGGGWAEAIAYTEVSIRRADLCLVESTAESVVAVVV